MKSPRLSIRSFPGFLLLLLLPGALSAQAPAVTQETTPAQAPAVTQQLTPALLATDLVDRLAGKDFQGATAHFADSLKAAIPPGQLPAVWAAIQSQIGAYKRRVAVRTEKQGAYEIVFVTAEFERATVDFKVSVDGTGKIGGFFVVPPQPAAGQAAQPEYAPPAYVHRDLFGEREVTVDAGGSGEWPLPGTLAVPAGPGPFPAVVLVHGSGPNDRDETIEGNKPFRDLAWGLASRGVAVLRYEKRTRQHADKLGGVKNFTVQEETVDDAVAAADLLRHTPGIDPRRVFVLGHSLGGMLVPRIGRRDPRLAGLIVMAGGGRPLEDIILEQAAYLGSISTGGVAAEARQQQLEYWRGEVAKVKALKPGDTSVALSAPASYWLDLRGYDPPAAAKALRQPLLILQGERDYQATMDDFRAWQRGLVGRPGVTFKTYPKLNHLFIEGEGKSTPAEYETPGHVSAAVIADIAAWIGR
jgi:dienelactone hydrolase